MARRFWVPNRRRRRPPKKKTFFLEETSARRIREVKLLGRAYTRLQWDYYSELAFHRAQVSDRLRDALLQAARGEFEFGKWQRVVRLKYALQPLSVAGSLVDPGGRFNIGDIDQSRYPMFPAFYVAKDRGAALKEAFQVNTEDQNSLDLALAKPTSIASVSLSGKLDSIIDLYEPESLESFVDIIRTFEVSPLLQRRAQALRATLPGLISSVDQLAAAVLSKSWKFDPMGLDIPSPCQIFGQLVANAGIVGIRYPSKYSGGECLAIYFQNFRNTDSWIALDDEPPAQLNVRRVDANVWKEKAAVLRGQTESD